VQCQAGGAAAGVGLEGNLCVDNLVEEIPLALREYREPRLPRSLHEKLVAFTSDGQDEVRPELVFANVPLEHLRINGDFVGLLGRGGGRALSLNPLGRRVGAVLVQRQACGAPAGIGPEGNLRIDDLEEEIALALRENLDLGLAGGLAKELVALARNR
jgi:hypothetical protein